MSTKRNALLPAGAAHNSENNKQQGHDLLRPCCVFYFFSSGCAEACVSAGWAGAALAFLRLGRGA